MRIYESLIIATMFLSIACDSNHSDMVEPSDKAHTVATPERSNLGTGYWSNSVDGFSLAWDRTDLYVETGGATTGVFREFAENHERLRLKTSNDSRCSAHHYFRLTSVVGTLVSFEHERSLSCGAVTSGYRRFTSVDVSKPGRYSYPRNADSDWQGDGASKVVSLTDYYSEGEVFAGLMANPEISGSFVGDTTQPTSVEEIQELLSRTGSESFGGAYSLSPDFLRQFSLYSIANDALVVRISLSPTTANLGPRDIDITLSVAPPLQKHLLNAVHLKGGFLLRDARDIVGTHVATFEFGNSD